MWPDIFNDDAFSLISLTAVINSQDNVPGRAGTLAFAGTGEGVATIAIQMENVQETISLIKTSPRGSAAPQGTQDKGTVRSVSIPQVKIEDTIGADQVQGVRVLGSASTLRGPQQVINRQIAKFSSNMDLTLENLRLGALRGQVRDADNSLLLDLFNYFGVTAANDVSFEDVFDAGVSEAGLDTVRVRAQQVLRFMKRNLKAPWPSSAQIWAFCGDNFFDKLVESTSVKNVWNGWAQAEQRLGNNYAQGVYNFAGIYWENYAGTDDQQTGNDVTSGQVQGTVGIDPDECQFFLTGVPGLYEEYYAPADFMDTVNTIGLPRYAKIAPVDNMNRAVKLHTQMNVLPICTRPRTLIKGNLTTA